MNILKARTLTLLFCISSLLSLGQDCSDIFTISEGSVFNSSGLGTTFNGKKANDGYLYFRGSVNGTSLSIWKTDGTAAGTSMVIEEANELGGNWNNFHFIDEGILIQNEGEWMLVSTGNNAITMLPEFGEINLNRIGDAGNGKYYLAGFSNGNYDGVEYDPSNNTATIIPNVHPGLSSFDVFAGDHGAMFYSAFSEASTRVYLTNTDELVSIFSYLANFGYQLDDYNGGTIYGKYMYASFKDTQGMFNHIIIDMENNEVTQLSGILLGDVSIVEHDNFIYFIGSTRVIKLDTDQFTTTSVFDDIYSFSPSMIFDNQLIVAGDNPATNQTQIAAIDVVTDEVTYLPGATLGVFFFNSKFLEFDNNFYYIAEDGNENLLNQYNFTSNQPVLVSKLSEFTGTTVEHALQEVQGNFVSSVSFNNIQHELAFCEVPESMVNVESTTIAVFPSPATDFLQFSENEISVANENIFVNSATGSNSSMEQLDGNGVLDISRLVPGLYFGTFLIDGEKLNFKFLKI